MGVGTTFEVELKLPPAPVPERSAPDAAEARAGASADNEEAEPREVNVLLVEDNPTNRKVATLLLEKLGYRVETAENGEKAVEVFQERSFDAVIMDLSMPVMDGYEATERIRSLEGDRGHTPIIALTANALDSDRERCYQVGMDDYLTKPVNKKILGSTLSRWIGVTAA